jgi:putative component of membrane protein insertase Oxa1/YidC/SpoIIIJ protein YidD
MCAGIFGIWRLKVCRWFQAGGIDQAREALNPLLIE